VLKFSIERFPSPALALPYRKNPMKRFLFCIAACLPVLASASSYAFSGKVTDASGNGIAGIWVGLSQAKIATLTASDGSWSLGATSGIASRTANRTAVTRHLVNENGHLQLSFDGKDLSGRNLSGTTTTSAALAATAAARTADAITDTLLYVRSDALLASTVVSSTSFQAGTLVLDTVSKRASYTRSGDTLATTFSTSYADIYCNSSTLETRFEYGAKTIPYLLHLTTDGFELTNLDSEESDNHFRSVAKFRRLSGEAGSVIGKFQLVGEVYRPLTANISDSLAKILAADSASSSNTDVEEGLIYEFTDTNLTLIGENQISFARQFLDNWTYANDAWYYSTNDSAWHDNRKYSDSTEHSIAVQIVDSSTVRLTGNTTKEVVTITSTNGFDQTYSSSNSAHATGTRLAVPTSCPESADWYSTFLSANPRITTAARVTGPSAVAPKHKKPRRF